MKFLFLFFPTFLLWHGLLGQEIHQTIRGNVLDQDSRAPMGGVKVLVLNSDPVLGAISQTDGTFRIEAVPLGRVSLHISRIGYEDQTLPNLLISSGKETVLTLELMESIREVEEVVIVANEDKTEALNDLALVSSRAFSVEETKRYAGAIDDPARMVSAFAGVNGNAEGNNDIVVRGNSPRGIQWRLEGIEIPNPNHFANEGATGGPINALNSNLLSNSDFFTGAFAPEYGNALSGVFDINLRNGNNEKREYSASLNVLGSDLTVEGPFSKGYSGSYLANYRYSTLALLDGAGLVDFNGVPKYQDASLKLLLPVGDKHVFSLFGLGGISRISQEEADPEQAERILWKSEFGNKLGVLGLSHTYLFHERAYWKTTLSVQATELSSTFDIIDRADELFAYSRSEFQKTSLQAASTLHYKLNARHKFKTGLILRQLSYRLLDREWSNTSEQLIPRLSQDGQAGQLQGFFSWKYRLTEELDMVSGVHYLHSFLNQRQSLEPRLAVRWAQSRRQSFSAGAGIHSKVEALATYLAQQPQVDGSLTQPNRNLGFSKAAHFVLGYDRTLSAHTRLKAELYYQHLYEVPVENVPGSTYSLLNASDWYTTRSLTNEGSGRNYGLELTLERFFQRGFYYLGTLSLYRSQYTPIDGVERNSAFDGNYVANFLGGKEFRLGKAEKNRTFFVNTKFALIGGQRYTPIDLEKSISAGYQIRDESHPFSAKGDDIFKWDLAIGLRKNYARTTHEFKIDAQNVTNHAAVVNQYYDSPTESILTSYQLSLLPVISYKIQF